MVPQFLCLGFQGTHGTSVKKPVFVVSFEVLEPPVHQGVGFDLNCSGSMGKCSFPHSLSSHCLLHPFSVLTSLDATVLARQKTGEGPALLTQQ